MNYFECVAANHGGGSSNTITVTCDSGFVGVTLTCTDGNDTYTKVCPSVSPYTVDFENLAAGDWTISGTVQGTSYSKVVSISDSYVTTLESGFSWATWVDLSQNYHSADYNSLADVFADEGALNELMTIHACCDYLIEAVADDITTIDDFCANDTAMKWIGLRDYVCDGLTAINGVEAKFLASQYWERYLKDHVPTMTSNTAPYGVASATSEYSSFSAYKAFDSDDSTTWLVNAKTNSRIVFKFANPINVKRFEVRANYDPQLSAASIKNYKIQYSDDGTNFTDVDSASFIYPNQSNYLDKHEIDDSGYHMYWAMYISDTYNTTSTSIAVLTLQFYGRSLNVSVPVMTSNTAPFGEVKSAVNTYDTVNMWKPFGRTLSESNSTVYDNVSNNLTVDYDFTTKICPKMVTFKSRINDYQLLTYKILGVVDGNTEEITVDSDTVTDSTYSYIVGKLSATKGYDTIKIKPLTTSGNSGTIGPNLYWTAHAIQIYGVDYSEREFEPNTNKKWLYDHGLELETLTTSGTVTKGSDYLTLSAANSEATANVDLTDYSILRCKVGDHMSGTTQLSVGGSNPAAATLTSDNAPNNNSLDISSLSQTLATGVKMTANGICDITELWVE